MSRVPGAAAILTSDLVLLGFVDDNGLRWVAFSRALWFGLTVACDCFDPAYSNIGMAKVSSGTWIPSLIYRLSKIAFALALLGYVTLVEVPLSFALAVSTGWIVLVFLSLHYSKAVFRSAWTVERGITYCRSIGCTDTG